MVCRLTGLIVLIDFFFNSLVVGVSCSLIFWHFWLFIDFRLVERGSEGFLPMPPSWPELQQSVLMCPGQVLLEVGPFFISLS